MEEISVLQFCLCQVLCNKEFGWPLSQGDSSQETVSKSWNFPSNRRIFVIHGGPWELTLMMWLRMVAGHARKTNPVNRRVGLWATYNQPNLGRGELETDFNHMAKDSVRLCNKTLIKLWIPNLGWVLLVPNVPQVSSYIDVSESWCVLTPQGEDNGSFTSGTLPDLTLSISSFCWFGWLSNFSLLS